MKNLCMILQTDFLLYTDGKGQLTGSYMLLYILYIICGIGVCVCVFDKEERREMTP